LSPAFFWWWYAYDAYAPRIFLEGGYVAASGGFMSIAVAIGMSVWRARETKDAATYGTAGWATPREVRAAPACLAKCSAGSGVTIFATMGLNTCCASHRRAAARGVGRVVPTLLTWLGSAIVSDIKRENWEITVGLRARIGRVLLFDPTKQNSAA
jgi:type IV secretion system protein VirD4